MQSTYPKDISVFVLTKCIGVEQQENCAHTHSGDNLVTFHWKSRKPKEIPVMFICSRWFEYLVGVTLPMVPRRERPKIISGEVRFISVRMRSTNNQLILFAKPKCMWRAEFHRNCIEFAICSNHSHHFTAAKSNTNNRYTSLLASCFDLMLTEKLCEVFMNERANGRRPGKNEEMMSTILMVSLSVSTHMSKFRFSAKSARFNFVHIEKYRKTLMSEANSVSPSMNRDKRRRRVCRSIVSASFFFSRHLIVEILGRKVLSVEWQRWNLLAQLSLYIHFSREK